MRLAFFLILALLPLGLPGQSISTPVTIKVDAGHPGTAISPQMFGIFFEDINFGADGGLYPELVKKPLVRVQRTSRRMA